MGLSGSSGLKNSGGTATSLAPNATGTTLALSGTATAQQFTSTQAAGFNGMLLNIPGARIKLSAGGTTDYIVSDGGSTLSMPAGGIFQSKLTAATVANSAQLTLLDTTNNKSFFVIVNNTTASVYDNSGANEIMRWTNTGNVRVFTDIAYASFTDGSGTTGNQTLNVVRGVCAIAAAGSACTITNSFVTVSSLVIPVLQTVDGTAKSVVAAPGVGSVVFTLNAASTGTVKIGFLVAN